MQFQTPADTEKELFVPKSFPQSISSVTDLRLDQKVKSTSYREAGGILAIHPFHVRIIVLLTRAGCPAPNHQSALDAHTCLNMISMETSFLVQE
jgi:hypothetical protein